jgi:hypothetical protein
MDINAINDLFDRDVADAQRGAPEMAMLAVQRAMGGGVLNFVVEHVGDLTHRMSEKVTANTGGYQYVEEKVRRALRFLNQGYGFDREFRENVQNNARARNIPEQQLMAQVDAALQAYAAAHQQIPVYNEVQRLARDAAVSLGYKQWNRASTFLMQLQNYLNEGIEAWTARSREYQGQRPQEKVAQYESDFSYLDVGHDTGQQVILWGHNGKQILQKEVVVDRGADMGISSTDHTAIFTPQENRSFLGWGRVEKATRRGSISFRPSLENGTFTGVLRNNNKIMQGIYLDAVKTFPGVNFTWYAVHGSKPANSLLKAAAGPEDFGFGQKEELDPELKRYLTVGPHFTALQHPLVYSVPYFPELNAMLNKQLRAKKEIIAKEEAAGDYRHAMWLHERPHRLNYFARIADRLSDEDYWRTLGTAYVDSENIWQNSALVRHLLSDPNRQGSRQMIMDEDDLAKYNTLPETFKVYRGCIAKNKNGMSWTLDPGKAEWFARRLSKKNPIVITGIVNKADVIAYFGGREEQEIVVDPRKVKNKQERQL